MKNEGTSRIILGTLSSTAIVAVVAGAMGLGTPMTTEVGSVEAQIVAAGNAVAGAEERALYIQSSSYIAIHPEVTLEDWVYGEEPNEPVVEGNPGKAEVTFEYKPADADDEEYTEEVPVNGGAYIVRATVAASYPYLSGQAEAEFSILKATPELGEVSVTMPPNTLDPADAIFERELIGVFGKFELLADTLEWGENDTAWRFTPLESDNFEEVEQEITVATWRQGWVELDGGDWAYYDDGMATFGWKKIDGGWFLFDSNGVMTTGWQKDGGWYFLGRSGKMRTGWLLDGGAWYWLGGANDGSMHTGWQQIGGVWYYFQTSGASKGALLMNGTTPDGYRVDANGAYIG